MEDSAVIVVATESRRLSDASPRQLAGTWKIDLTVTYSAAKSAAVESKVTALKTSTASLTTELKKQLKAAGAEGNTNSQNGTNHIIISIHGLYI